MTLAKPFCSIWLVFVIAAFPPEQGAPLPTVEELRDRMLARAKAIDASGLWYEYQYGRKSVRSELEPDGRVKQHNEYVYVMVPRDGVSYPRLLSKNGAAPSARDLAQEEERYKTARRRLEERRRTGVATTDDRVLSGDVLARFDFRIEGREQLKGRNTIRVALRPAANPPEARTQTDKVLNRVSGQVWLDEALWDLARADVRLTEPVSFYGGLGIVRRLTIVYEAQLVDGRMWFPLQFDMELDGRRLLNQTRTRISESFFDFQRHGSGGEP